MALDPEMSKALAHSVNSLRNTAPSSFALATDSSVGQIDRWKAFDKFFGLVCDDMKVRGFVFDEQSDSATALEEQHRQRQLVAITMLNISMGGGGVEELNAALYEVETLVPTPPDLNTGLPQMSCRDESLLFMLTKVCKEEFPDEWIGFFKADSLPLEYRRHCFKVMYNTIFPIWQEESFFPKSLPELEKQRWVAYGLMCWVPRDQWTIADFDEMCGELLPVEVWDIPMPPKE